MKNYEAGAIVERKGHIIYITLSFTSVDEAMMNFDNMTKQIKDSGVLKNIQPRFESTENGDKMSAP